MPSDFISAQGKRAEAASGLGRPRFADRNVLVTGAAKGIGAAIPSQFVLEGAHVVGADIDADSLEVLAESLQGLELTFQPVQADITSPESARTLLETASRGTGVLDVLVNNAAVSCWPVRKQPITSGPERWM